MGFGDAVRVTLAITSGVSLPLTMGAIIAGGSIGDNVYPMGETPITTAAICDIPIFAHIQTTLPYALVVIVASVLLYGLLGLR